jgi:hypothetical protein
MTIQSIARRLLSEARGVGTNSADVPPADVLGTRCSLCASPISDPSMHQLLTLWDMTADEVNALSNRLARHGRLVWCPSCVQMVPTGTRELARYGPFRWPKLVEVYSFWSGLLRTIWSCPDWCRNTHSQKPCEWWNEREAWRERVAALAAEEAGVGLRGDRASNAFLRVLKGIPMQQALDSRCRGPVCW